FRVRVQNQGQTLRAWLGNQTIDFTTPYPVENSAYHHVVMTYDGAGTLTMYLDGQSLGTAGVASLNTCACSLNLGWTLNGLDEGAVYPTALSATQVLTHFNASGNTRPTAPSNVSATAGANQAGLSWGASSASGS